MGAKVHRLAWTDKRAPAGEQVPSLPDLASKCPACRVVYLQCQHSALFQRIADTQADTMKARGSVRCCGVSGFGTPHPSPPTAPLPRAI